MQNFAKNCLVNFKSFVIFHTINAKKQCIFEIHCFFLFCTVFSILQYCAKSVICPTGEDLPFFLVYLREKWYNAYTMLTVTPLFSGSRGNCTLIRTDNTAVLLDAGYGFKAIQSKLKDLGISPQEISAIVVTHEHSDHVSALPVWSRRYRTKVFAPPLTSTYLSMQGVYNIQEVKGSFQVDDLTVFPYQCSHDARNCFGYRFTAGNNSVASVTDTGEASAELVPFLAPCNTIILESNHDLDMLWNGDYPFYLKNRINSKYGHLSNTQAAEVLCKLIGSNVKNVILAHLSQQNNTKTLALTSATEMYAKNGVKVGADVNVYVADQYFNEITI